MGWNLADVPSATLHATLAANTQIVSVPLWNPGASIRLQPARLYGNLPHGAARHNISRSRSTKVINEYFEKVLCSPPYDDALPGCGSIFDNLLGKLTMLSSSRVSTG